MLDTLILVLILFAVVLVGQAIALTVGGACLSAVAYTIWVERTGGLAVIAASMLKKPDDPSAGIPEGFRESYCWYTDPVTGNKSLLPIEEVELKKQEAAEAEMGIDEIDEWVSGKPERTKY